MRINPRSAEALHVQGLLAHHRGELPRAGEYLRLALAARPDFAEAHLALGCLLNDAGNYPGAIQAFEQAAALGLRSPYLHFNLGVAWHRQGRLDEAGNAYRQALEIDPNFFMALDNLGTIHEGLGELDQAETCFRRSLRINGHNPIAYNNLADVLKKKGSFVAAEACCQKALELDPHHAKAYKNLCYICYVLGKAEESVAWFRRYLAIEPNPVYHSGLLMAMHYPADVSQAEIFAESVRWSELHESGRAEGSPGHTNRRERDRRLRIGYLSADFWDHSVAHFIEPVLRCHNREHVEVFCYANLPKVDAVTARLRNLADHWREIRTLDDLQTAALIREDQIDILVDLGGHTGDNRLQVFALRPAPLQVTWLGYTGTTGMKGMDYRLTDPVADPPGQDDQYYSETLLRMEGGFLCYQPEASAPPVTPLPCLEQGCITFGSFNKLAKITPKVIELWARIMLAVPGSRLVLKNRVLAIPEIADRYAQKFAAFGVARERLEILGAQSAKEDHLALYGRIDLALDPFPYNGVTTTFEALWMGVPVVALLGDRHSGRVAASILQWLGLAELVADSPQAYLELAVALANEPQRLAALRDGMRSRLRDSPTLDGRRFSAALEEVYRRIWVKWCETAT